jgi:uncharacterized protein (DUF2225 family)
MADHYSGSHNKPFFEKEATCPVCKATGTHYYLRDHSYVINQRDEDFYIKDYTWAEPEYNAYNLHGFGLWYCTFCHYADDKYLFYQKEMNSGRAYFEYVKKAILAKSQENDALIEMLKSHIHYPSYDLRITLHVTLMGIYVHTLPDITYQYYDKVAKLYLRAAWLFRILSEKPEKEKITQFVNAYSSRFERLQGSTMNALASLEELNELIINQNRLKLRAPYWQTLWGKQYNFLAENYHTTCAAVDKILAAIKTYYDAGSLLKNALNDLEKTMLELPYENYEHYNDFLAELNSLSPNLPTDEVSAYKKAVEYFSRAVHSKAYDLDTVKKFKVNDLIISISEKIQDYATALDLCEKMERQTSHFYKILTNRLRQQEILPDETVDPERIKMLLRQNQEIMRAMQIKKKRLKPLKLKRDRVLAKQILSQFENIEKVELRKKMEEAKIDESVIKSYINTKHEDNNSNMKKGLFDVFKF